MSDDPLVIQAARVFSECRDTLAQWHVMAEEHEPIIRALSDAWGNDDQMEALRRSHGERAVNLAIQISIGSLRSLLRLREAEETLRLVNSKPPRLPN